VLGTVVWYSFHESGVHATIAGVILGLMTPARSYLDLTLFGRMLESAYEVTHGNWDAVSHRAEGVRRFQRAVRETISPLEYLETMLHPWVSFVIMPVFALANAGVVVGFGDFVNPVALAVMAGLALGKPVGIFVVSWIGVRWGIASLPQGVTWEVVLGGGALAGIGFTMALFISGLALDGGALDAAKVGVLSGSAVSAVVGMALLTYLLPRHQEPV
jgi:NhaA family Na+:H+ antiporter